MRGSGGKELWRLKGRCWGCLRVVAGRSGCSACSPLPMLLLAPAPSRPVAAAHYACSKSSPFWKGEPGKYVLSGWQPNTLVGLQRCVATCGDFLAGFARQLCPTADASDMTGVEGSRTALYGPCLLPQDVSQALGVVPVASLA